MIKRICWGQTETQWGFCLLRRFSGLVCSCWRLKKNFLAVLCSKSLVVNTNRSDHWLTVDQNWKQNLTASLKWKGSLSLEKKMRVSASVFSKSNNKSFSVPAQPVTLTGDLKSLNSSAKNATFYSKPLFYLSCDNESTTDKQKNVIKTIIVCNHWVT